MQAPANNEAAVNVNDGRQIIRRLPEIAQGSSAIYRVNAHLAHQATDSTQADIETTLKQKVSHSYNHLGRMFGMLLIYLLHNPQVLLALAFGLIVMDRAAQAKNLALFLDADLASLGNQSSAGISIPNCLDTCLTTNRTSEHKEQTCSCFVERRRLKPQVNPAASPSPEVSGLLLFECRIVNLGCLK